MKVFTSLYLDIHRSSCVISFKIIGSSTLTYSTNYKQMVS